MGATTPGKPVPGKPPKGMDEGGPKVTPAPLPPVADKPIGEKAGPSLFGQLLEGIKKTDKFKNRGPGGLRGPLMGPDGPKPPVFDDRIYAGGSSPIPGVGGHEYLNNPKYAEHRKEYYGKKNKKRTGIEAAPTRPIITDTLADPSFGMQAPYTPKSAYKDEMESVLRESKGSRTDDVVNRIKEIEERERERRAGRSPNRFPMGGNERDDSPFSQERFDSYQAGFRPRKKEAVFFGEREPSSESKRPTKGGMRKAGPKPSPEAKSKFEELLAYMKSFQR